MKEAEALARTKGGDKLAAQLRGAQRVHAGRHQRGAGRDRGADDARGSRGDLRQHDSEGAAAGRHVRKGGGMRQGTSPMLSRRCAATHVIFC